MGVAVADHRKLHNKRQTAQVECTISPSHPGDFFIYRRQSKIIISLGSGAYHYPRINRRFGARFHFFSYSRYLKARVRTQIRPFGQLNFCAHFEKHSSSVLISKKKTQGFISKNRMEVKNCRVLMYFQKNEGTYFRKLVSEDLFPRTCFRKQQGLISIK